jgi:quercetin dioxygenase-like cupin family protein
MEPPYWFFGTHLRVLTDEHQTGSGYDLIEGRFPTGTETHLHLHTRYDELIYVLEETFTVYANAGKTTLAPGEHIFVPRNTAHAVAGTGPAANRSLTIPSLSGFANLVRTAGIADLAEGIAPGHSNDIGLFLRLTQDTGDVIVATPGARPVLKLPEPPSRRVAGCNAKAGPHQDNSLVRTCFRCQRGRPAVKPGW